MKKINRVIYKVIIGAVTLVGIANIADCIYAGGFVNAATDGSSNFTPSVVINPSATISISNGTPSLSVTPGKNGTFAYTATPISLSVATNTANNVAVQMVPTAIDTPACDTSANLTKLCTTSGATIDTLSAATANDNADFKNKWGYAWATSNSSAPTTYNPVANPTTVTNYTAKQSATTSYVYFGMMVDQATAPGSYKRNFTFQTVVTQ